MLRQCAVGLSRKAMLGEIMYRPSRTHRDNSAGSIDLGSRGVGNEQGGCGQASLHRGKWRLDWSIMGHQLELLSAAVFPLMWLAHLVSVSLGKHPKPKRITPSSFF